MTDNEPHQGHPDSLKSDPVEALIDEVEALVACLYSISRSGAPVPRERQTTDEFQMMADILLGSRDVRMSMRAPFQNHVREAIADSDFINELEERLRGIDLPRRIDIGLVEKVLQMYEFKKPLINEAKRRFLEYFKSTSVDFYGVTELATEDTFEERYILDTLYALGITGSLDVSQSLQLHSICGGNGMEGFVASIFREGGETFATCHDNSPIRRKSNEVLREHAFCMRKGFRFEDGDVANAKFYKRQGARNVWLIQNPSDATGIVTERLARLPKAEMPDAIAMVPCSCCSYDQDYYPKDGAAEITREEWARLRAMVRKYYKSPKGNILDKKNLGSATQIMDRVRASYINRHNPDLKAVVHTMPSIDKGQNAIYIEPR